MAEEIKGLLEQWQEFKGEYIDPALYYINPFRDVEIDRLEGKDFLSKWKDTVQVFEGTEGVKGEPGILDWLCAGIPRFLVTVLWSLFPTHTKTEPMNPLHWIWVGPLLGISLLWRYTQKFVAYLLAAIGTPFVGLVHWLYPYDQNFVDEAAENGEDYKKGTVGRNRRRAFFNPSTWMFIGFVVPLAISFLIQGLASNGLLGAEILAQAAGPLLMIQTVFTGLAALMLVGAVLGLVHHAYEVLTTNADDGTPDYPKSAVVEYFKDLYKWMSDHKAVAIPVMFLCVGSVLAALVLIIGYFTGFGFPGVFDFMLPVFNFIGTGFASGIQGLSSLPGLGFLGGIAAGPGLELASQVFTIFALVAGAIFTVDTVRRVTQTATEGGGPVVALKNQEDLDKKPHDPEPGLLEQLLSSFTSLWAKPEGAKNSDHLQRQQQREQALNAEAELMAKPNQDNPRNGEFTEIRIAKRSSDYKVVATNDGSGTTEMAELVQGQRVYLQPAQEGSTFAWGSIGPNARPGWVSIADLQPIVNLSQLTNNHPNASK